MMSTKEYFDEMQKIQKFIDEFLDEEANLEESFQNLIDIFDNLKIHESKHKTKSILYLISKSSNDRHRYSNFFKKIEIILNYFKNDIKKYFSNKDIFKIFLKNKRILLFLIKNDIIVVDDDFYYTITKPNYALKLYPQYFIKEIKPFIQIDNLRREKRKEFPIGMIWAVDFKDDIPEDFEEKREIGENDNFLCEMIRKDKIEDFITYVNRQELSLETEIKPSIFETNDFLLKRNPSVVLIEYAAFFGSTQIFKYLYLNKVKLNPNIWLFAIHGDNPEIIHMIENSSITPFHIIGINYLTISYKEILKESIKCHHNNITEYVLSNYMNNEDFYDNITKCYYENIYSYCLHYYNFLYLPNEMKYEIIYYACQYDHFFIVDYFIKNKIITLNDHIIIINKKIF